MKCLTTRCPSCRNSRGDYILYGVMGSLAIVLVITLLVASLAPHRHQPPASVRVLEPGTYIVKESNK